MRLLLAVLSRVVPIPCLNHSGAQSTHRWRLPSEKAETERKSTALELAEKLKSLKITIPVPVSEEGTLYGSIGTREISDAINSHGLEVEKGTIRLPEGTLKELGEYQIDIDLHPEVIQEISITISAEE